MPNDNEDSKEPKLRIRIHFNYSDIQKYTSLSEHWDETISSDVNEITWIKKYLRDLTEPFGFFLHMADDHGSHELSPEDIEDMNQEI